MSCLDGRLCSCRAFQANLCSSVVFDCLVGEYLVLTRGQHGGAGGGGPDGAAAVLGGERGHVLLGHHLPGGGGQVGGCGGVHVRPPAGQPPRPAAALARARTRVKIQLMHEHRLNTDVSSFQQDFGPSRREVCSLSFGFCQIEGSACLRSDQSPLSLFETAKKGVVPI
jgi:hypothetical protein